MPAGHDVSAVQDVAADVAPASDLAAPASDLAAPAADLQVASVAPPAALSPAADQTPHQGIDASVDHTPSSPTVATFTPIAGLPPPVRPTTAVAAALPSSTADVRAYIRQSAQQRGIDPDTAVRVVLSEGGLTPATWVGDYGSSFGPFQLHYGGIAGGGNAVGGLGDAFTAETHLDARDPSTWHQQVDWALNRAARDGWGAWHGAARADIGPRDGIGVAVAPTYATAMIPAGQQHAHVSVPNQFASNLSPQEAYAACGPAAAVALARYLGRTPTVAEALDLAKQSGWTLSGGMNGISNEKRLLDAMHINAQIETPLNWRHVQLDAARGTPVVISTPNHYWVVDDYDPVTGEYHVGQSGLVFAGGAEWMTADRIQQLGGGLSGGLYIDNPTVAPSPVAAPSPRIVDAGWTAPSAPHVATRAAALDPGWTAAGSPAGPAPTQPVTPPATEPAVAAAPSETAVADVVAANPPNPDRWWEDSRLVRGDTPPGPKTGPEWV